MKIVETLAAAAVAVLTPPVERAAHADSDPLFCELLELEIELTPPRDCVQINVESQVAFMSNDCEVRVDLQDWPIDLGRNRDLTLYPGERTDFRLPYSDELEEGTYPFDLALELRVAGEPAVLDMAGVADCNRSHYSFDPGGDEGCSAGGSAPGGLAALVLLIAIALGRRPGRERGQGAPWTWRSRKASTSSKAMRTPGASMSSSKPCSKKAPS